MQRSFKQSRVLLTGASSGIGRALALELAAAGAELVLLARREERLEELAAEIRARFSDLSPKVLTVCGDVTDPQTRQVAVETARRELGGIDYLINNAGVGATCRIEATSDELLHRLMDVNYFSAVGLTQATLPSLRESAQSEERQKLGVRPMVVFLGSIVGLRGVPHYGAYGAAKFAVAGISESLRTELSSEGIDVLLVSPGTTKTEFFDVLLESSSAPDLPAHKSVSSESVAREILAAMRRGKHRIIPYFPAKILYYLNRLCPGLVDRIMLRYR